MGSQSFPLDSQHVTIIVAESDLNEVRQLSTLGHSVLNVNSNLALLTTKHSHLFITYALCLECFLLSFPWLTCRAFIILIILLARERALICLDYSVFKSNC